MDRSMSPGTNAAQNSKRMKLLLTALFLLCIAAGPLGCSAAEENDADDTPVEVTVDAPSTVSASNISGLVTHSREKRIFQFGRQNRVFVREFDGYRVHL